MRSNKIAYTVATILNAAAAVAYAEDALVSSNELSEVVVTAQRKEQSLQDVPISVEVVTAEALNQLNARNFDDIVKYLPSVSQASNGPGQTNIYIRGLEIGSGGTGAAAPSAISRTLPCISMSSPSNSRT